MVIRLVGSFILLAMTLLPSGFSALQQQSNSLRRNAVVLLDPVTEWRSVLEETQQMDVACISVQLSPIDDRMRPFVPTVQVLKDAGAECVLDLQHCDVYACAQKLKTLERRNSLRIVGIVPLSETAVEFSDIISAMMGLTSGFNPLDSVLCRREKGLMKEVVGNAGLRVASFARLSGKEELRASMEELGLSFPVVIKTPQGFSTTDVRICSDTVEAEEAIDCIVGSRGPDGRLVSEALMEEFIGGIEFAVNVMAFDGEITVTDVWRYEKTDKAGYISAEICDPHDPGMSEIVEYASNVAQAVGIRYGAGHVELKATVDDDGTFRDPCLIEVGARLSGGRKSTLSKIAMGEKGWNPFHTLICAHYGMRPKFCTNFSPEHFVRHVFLPVEQAGHVQSVEEDIFGKLSTLHSHAVLVRPGDKVSITSDITSNAAFAWLVGAREDVDRDTTELRSKFRLHFSEIE